MYTSLYKPGFVISITCSTFFIYSLSGEQIYGYVCTLNLLLLTYHLIDHNILFISVSLALHHSHAITLTNADIL